jgi:hypothetical protein
MLEIRPDRFGSITENSAPKAGSFRRFSQTLAFCFQSHTCENPVFGVVFHFVILFYYTVKNISCQAIFLFWGKKIPRVPHFVAHTGACRLV